MGKNLTKQQQQIIVLAILFIGGGGYGYWNYMMKPTFERIKKFEQQYEELEKKIKRAEAQAKRLPALKNELEDLQVELSQLEKQLPRDKDIPNIIRTLTREALREDLAFFRITPGGVKSDQYFETIPFSISYSGGLHALVRFLAALGQQERIYRAGNVTLSPVGGQTIDGDKELNISIEIETYAYKG